MRTFPLFKTWCPELNQKYLSLIIHLADVEFGTGGFGLDPGVGPTSHGTTDLGGDTGSSTYGGGDSGGGLSLGQEFVKLCSLLQPEGLMHDLKLGE